MDKKNTKMNAKRNLVSFLLIASVLFLAASVSAAVTIDYVTVDGIEAGTSDISVTAGDTIPVKVYITAEDGDDFSEVVVIADLDGEEVETDEFSVVADSGEVNTYKKVLNIEVPYDFDDDELYKDLDLDISIEIDGDEDPDGDSESYVLQAQRPEYNVEIKPIHVPSSVEAGEDFSVDVIVENNGYNDLDDLYITASIPELGVEETYYLGDLTDVVEDEDESSVHKIISLEVPYDAEAGEYVLEVAVSNEDANVAKATVVVTENSVPNQVIKTENGLIIINPTDKVAVYTVVAEAPASVSQSTVVVEDGSSAEVTVTTNTNEEVSVNVFSATGELIDTVTFKGSTQSAEFELTSPVFMLTVILAVVFLVLLVVLIVLITKKPQKAEEFGESYY